MNRSVGEETLSFDAFVLSVDKQFKKVRRSVDLENDSNAIFKTIFTSICGSDLRISKYGDSRIIEDRVLGHEIVAEVIYPGLRTDFIPGDIVAIGADIPCGLCVYCLRKRSNLCEVHTAVGYQFDGGFAEYVVFPNKFLKYAPIVKVENSPKSFVYSLAEPAGCVINGLEFSRVEPTNSVAVIGAGPIGVMLAKLAMEYSSVPREQIALIEPISKRFDAVNKLGFKVFSNHEQVLKESLEFDRVFTATSNPDSHFSAIKLLRRGGVLNFFGGVPKELSKPIIDPNLLHYSEFTVGGSHGSTPRQHEIAVGLISKDIEFWENLITSKFSLSELPIAFESLRKGHDMKVGIYFGQ